MLYVFKYTVYSLYNHLFGKQFAMHRPIIYFAVLLMTLVSVSCSTAYTTVSTPTVISPPTPGKIKLLNGEIEACLLISSTEVETVSGIKVTSEIGLMSDSTYCRYISANDGEVILLTSTTTEATLKKQKKSYSVAESYDMQKAVDKDMAEREPQLFKIQEIDNWGNQAYLLEGTLSNININVLKNDIVYVFSTQAIDSGGIGYDALMKLAEIALKRMP